MKDTARDRDKGNNFHVTRNATQKAQEPFSIRVELVCVRERHWKGIEPSTSHTTQMLSLGYIPSLFKINCFKRILFTHTQARTLAHGACMHACSHNWRCQQEFRRGHWIPCRWRCPMCVLGMFSARHVPVCASKHRAILSSYPNPTIALSPETSPSSSVKASLEILIFKPQPSM